MSQENPTPEVTRNALGVLFDALPLPVFVMDSAWRIILANQAMLELFGYERGELDGANVDVLVPEQLRERYLSLRTGASAGEQHGVLSRGERVMRAKNGREIPVQAALARVVLDGTEFRVSSIFDVSAQKEAEVDTIERLYSIIEHSEVGLFMVQATEDGAFLYESFNPVTERRTGMRTEQARGRRPDQVVPGAEAARITEHYRRAVELGTPMTYEESAETQEGRRVFRTTLVPIRNRAGLVHRLLGLSHDITEHRRVETALAAVQQSLLESEEKSSKAFRASPHPIGITELPAGRLLEVNDAFERVFGHSREEALGKTTVELGLWDHAQREQMLDLLQDTSSFRDLEMRGKHRDGHALELLLSGEVIELADSRCLVTYVHDVTEKRRVERANAELEGQLRQAQKMDALGTLAGGIAHDFNNILGAILAYAELIKMDAHLPQQVESYVVELRKAGERAKDLVQQILTFSRRQPQQRRPVRIDVAVRDATNLLRSTLPATIRIQARLGQDTPVVLADITQIHQIVTNLGTNAAHAMQRSAGTLGITLDTALVDAATA
ncbi:MAG TPA: PAS domain S-box protein, partial [Polyangiaceae bacterium]|nr:PAS domain S-box protein [Polyangiaceae bacterium]